MRKIKILKISTKKINIGFILQFYSCHSHKRIHLNLVDLPVIFKIWGKEVVDEGYKGDTSDVKWTSKVKIAIICVLSWLCSTRETTGLFTGN